MNLINKVDFSKATHLEKYNLDALSSPLMKLLKIDEVNKIYKNNHHLNGIDFIHSVLDELGIKIEIEENDLFNIPTEGSFIAIANHPFGGIDGLILLKIFASVRPDFKAMANFLLHRIKTLENYIIPVNPFDNLSVNKSSLKGIKQTLDCLQNGIPVGLFPAGEVSSFQLQSKSIMDREWRPMIGKLITKAQVPVIPVHFSGSNSPLFNFLGMLHPNLRTVKLPSELFNKKGTIIKMRIGKPISQKRISDFNSNDQLVRYLRARTYAIGSDIEVKKFFNNPFGQKLKIDPIVPETNSNLIASEINNLLNTENHLFSHENYDLFAALSNKIPNTLNEIGRLREITFREAGEGTNKTIDIDEFDLYYHHLFMWDREAKKIVGSYRIGKGNDIYRQYRKKGFYINTLFKLNNEFVPYLKKSLELGRSFITKDYQQKHLSLFLLWKGILVFLDKNKGYRYLIGPVSISNKYSKTSKALMIEMIKQNYFDQKLAEYVIPRVKFRYNPMVMDTEILLNKGKDALKNAEELISEIEPLSYKIPVLLKKYLKQNAKIIGFNTDPKFSNSLDGFVMMDFEKIPLETLNMLEKK